LPINQPRVMIGNAGERFDAQWNLTGEATKDLIRRRAPESSGVDRATRAIVK
jgi:hypothetical protein